MACGPQLPVVSLHWGQAGGNGLLATPCNARLAINGRTQRRGADMRPYGGPQSCKKKSAMPAKKGVTRVVRERAEVYAVAMVSSRCWGLMHPVRTRAAQRVLFASLSDHTHVPWCPCAAVQLRAACGCRTPTELVRRDGAPDGRGVLRVRPAAGAVAVGGGSLGGGAGTMLKAARSSGSLRYTQNCGGFGRRVMPRGYAMDCGAVHGRRNSRCCGGGRVAG